MTELYVLGDTIMVEGYAVATMRADCPASVREQFESFLRSYERRRRQVLSNPDELEDA